MLSKHMPRYGLRILGPNMVRAAPGGAKPPCARQQCQSHSSPSRIDGDVVFIEFTFQTRGILDQATGSVRVSAAVAHADGQEGNIVAGTSCSRVLSASEYRRIARTVKFSQYSTSATLFNEFLSIITPQAPELLVAYCYQHFARKLWAVYRLSSDSSMAR